jgi:hypothetical protein
MADSTWFPERNELKRFARKFVRERISSLKKDVNHCLNSPYAPFPAILYCFSTIDLMGALYAGKAVSIDPQTQQRVPLTANSKEYMKKFMNYTTEQCNFLMDLYRHKLVHLAQPRPVIRDSDNRVVSWQYYHDNAEKHLLLEDAPQDSKIQVKSGTSITVNKIFNIGIQQLCADIEDSVEGHSGYIDKLEDVVIQDKFEDALKQIYDSLQ